MTLRWGNRAAGIVLVARSTGNVLFLLRSLGVNEGGTWGIPGGKVDHGENARTSAVRELEEETGYGDDVNVLAEPIHRYEEPGFEFLTYFGYVEDEFEPELNWESDDYRWSPVTRVPKPTHPGVVEMLGKRRKAIAAEIRKIRSLP